MLCVNCQESFKSIKSISAHWKSLVCTWGKVVELRKAGKESEADTLVRKITGTYKEMTEEAKEKLKNYYEDHKEEILAKAKLKRMTRQAIERSIEKRTNKLNR